MAERQFISLRGLFLILSGCVVPGRPQFGNSPAGLGPMPFLNLLARLLCRRLGETQRSYLGHESLLLQRSTRNKRELFSLNEDLFLGLNIKGVLMP
jgi:hypothetical protein